MKNEKRISFEHINKKDILNIICKPYKLIFLNPEGKISIIEFLDYSNYNNRQKNNNNEIKYNINITNKKEIDKNIKLMNGIIYIYNIKQKEIFNNTFDYILKINKSLEKKIFFPTIILGDINEFKENINKKHKFEKIKNIRFITPECNINNSIKKAIEEFIKMKDIKEINDTFINHNQINEKQILNNLSKLEINLLKCLNCNQIYEILIDPHYNLIQIYCNKCKLKKEFDILDFDFSKSRKCSKCKKNLIETNSINYCFKCKIYFCNECMKNHSHPEEKSNFYPNNLVDVICNIHNKICYNYCLECKKNICVDCELQYHVSHKTQIFDNKLINIILNIQKKKLEAEKHKFNVLKMIVEDCLNLLKQYLYKLIEYKEKEINIKEEIIQQLEFYKYDNILIDNVKKLNFLNIENSTHNSKNSWEKKLNDIFDMLNEPIKIKRTKLNLKKYIKGPFDILQRVDLTKSIISHKECENTITEFITDLCPLDNYLKKNYFAVSFNTGLLKIYNDDFDNKIPINIIKEFETHEGINFLYKSSGRSLLLISNSKIKKLFFSEDLKEYNIINEIEVNEEVFKMVFEMNLFNALITTNNLNQLIFYDLKTGNQISNVTKFIESGEEKEITFIDKISENKIIIQLNNIYDLSEINMEKESLVSNFGETDNDNNNDINKNNIKTSLLNNNNYNEKGFENKYWKIIEFEMKENKIQIRNNFLIHKDLVYLGKINDQLLLLFDKIQNNLNLFNFNSYSNIKQLPFKSSQKPIGSYLLCKRTDILDILFLCEEDYLTEYSLNLKMGFIYETDKIKIGLDSNNITKGILENSTFNKKEDKEKNEINNNIVKIINFNKTNFLLMTRDNLLYNFKN